MRKLRSALVVLALGSVGCSTPATKAGSEPPPTSQPDTQSGRCEPDGRIGGFEVSLDDSFTTVTGQVKDGFVQSVFLADVAASDVCRLIRRTNPFCDPTCTSPDICSTDMKCVPEPLAQSVGTVAVTGLEAEVSMAPAKPGNRYFFTDLPQPGMLPGESITLESEGAEIASFALHGEGVAPVDLADGNWELQRGKSIELSWTPAKNASKTRVRATLNVDQHGSAPVTLQCEYADEGSGTIPAELVDALLDAGISGFPNGNVYRETSENADLGEGCVDFVVSAHVKRDIVVPE